MKTKLLITLIIGSSLLLSSAEDGGLTGEVNVPAPPRERESAINICEMVRLHGRNCAGILTKAVEEINAGTATAFWQRVGTKGKRTLKWLNDLLATADAAAPTGEDYINPAVRLTLSKWTTNPDNTVSVSP